MGEEYFKKVLDELEEGVSIIDRDFRIEWVNKALKNKGFDIDCIKGHKCHMVYKQNSKICKGCPPLRVFRTGKSVTLTEKGADGKDYEVTAIPIKEQGKVVKVVEIVKEDIDSVLQHKIADQSNAKCESFIHNAEDMIFLIDRDFRVMTANKKSISQFGKMNPVGKTVPELFPKKIAEFQCYNLRRVFRTGKAMILESMIVLDGEEKWISTTLNPVKNLKGEIESVMGISRDITERKRSEEEFRRSKQMIELVIESIPSRIFWKDINLNYLGCNTLFAKDAGKKKAEDLIGKDDYQMGWKEQADLYRADDRKVIKTGKEKLNYEEPQTTPKGDHIWLRTSKRPLRNIEGNVIGIMGVYDDITEKKKTEKRLQESEEKYKLIAEGTDDMIGILTLELNPKFVYVSPSSKRMMGYDPKDLIGRSAMWLVHPEDLKAMLPILKNVLSLKIRGKLPRSYSRYNRLVYRAKGKNGEWHYIESTINTVGDHMLFISKDVTQRKKAEEALKESKEFSELLLNTAQAIILFLDTKGKIVKFNPYMEKISGYRLKEVQGKDWFSTFLPKKDWPRIKRLFQKSVRNISTKGNVNPIVTKSGKEINIEWYDKVLKDDDGKVMGILSIGQDVTEKKKAEEELKRSENIFRDLYEITTMVKGSTDKVLSEICRKVHEVFGGFFVLVNYVKEGEFNFKAGYNLPRVVLKLGKEPIKGAICSHVLESKKPLFNNNLQKDKCPTCRMPYSKDSAVGVFGLNTYFGVPLVFSGGIIRGTLCIVYKEKKEPFSAKDTKLLTLFAKRIAVELEREESMISLRQSEHKYKTTVENTLDLIYSLSTDGKVTFITSNVLRYGYSADEVIGQSMLKFVHPEDHKKFLDDFKETIKKGVEFPTRFRLLKKNGSFIWVEELSKALKEKGRVVRINGTIRDITKQKKAEQKLKESEQKFRRLFEGIADAAFAADPKTRKLVDCNKQAEILVGRSREEILAMPADKLHPKDRVKDTMDAFKKQAKGEIITVDSEVITKKNKRIPVSINTSVVETAEGPVMLGIFRDVTEQKKAARAILVAQKRYKGLFELSQDAIMTLEPPTWAFTSGNPATVKMFGCKDEKDFTSRGLWQYSPEKQPDGKPSKIKAKEMIMKAMKGGRNFFEWDHMRLNGEIFPATVLLSRMDIGGKKFLQATVRDITKQKKAEDYVLQNETKFRELFNNMASGVAIYKAVDNGNDFVFTDFNKAGEIIDNIKKKDIIGKNLTTAYPGVRKSGLLDALRNVWKTGKPASIPESFYQDKRIQGWRSNHAYKLPSGEVVVVFGDITDKKKSEESLKKAYDNLKKRTAELEKFNKLAIGREIMMIKLKQELNDLKRGKQ